MICPLHAWGDESIRSHGLDAPAYLLGASIVDTDDVPATRDTLEALRPTHGKLHWHDLNPRERQRVVSVIGKLEAFHLVVVASPIDHRREERARALCLERLAWELASHDVTALTLEARSRRLMDRDLRTVRALRGRFVVPSSLRIQHGDPKAEPMLWLPDQVLGAFGRARAERREIDAAIRGSLDTFDVEP
ncbi:hypothetical protein GCM10017714_23290 [Curtobacterium pusillum]|uniref:Uncharacterized protein n=1 Tax=Curtobacterium pusillum TaxID=69373 RepID=A0AAW3T3N8_9MICO|nr:hypothetical protein [Curtobacterium pusillum]MBA8989608.1 hypothetical protein [Curtobacterium pusillum]NUU14899.1 hypothetical protein [Curtobacterium pusillum]GLK32461.1 hypothetical protein GCM10017610_27460 [Curtobacterium pusillum]